MLSHYHNFEAVENVHFVFTSMVLHIHVWSLYAVLIPFFFISKESSMVNVLIYQPKKKSMVNVLKLSLTVCLALQIYNPWCILPVCSGDTSF